MGQVVSFFPATAPLAMPNRIAMGATAWWEPLVAVLLTLAAIAGLVVFGGRVYAGGVLHSGPALSLRAAWRGATVPAAARESATMERSTDRLTTGVLLGVGVALGATLAAMTGDVVIGVAVGAGFSTVAVRIVRARADRRDMRLGDR